MRRPRRPGKKLASLVVFVLAAAVYLTRQYDGERATDRRDSRDHATSTNERSAVGNARVHDGDTLRIGETRVRFFGVDAPELSQTCMEADGRSWRCGEAARDALIAKIGDAEVTCTERDRDRYGRTVGVCFARNEDLNAWMAEQGWAVAYREYSTDYIDEEERANAARRGVWRGTFTPPKDFRRHAGTGSGDQKR